MNIEIEKRWAICTKSIDLDFLKRANVREIVQTYMTPQDASPIIRVRTIHEGSRHYAIQTIKSPAPGGGNFEIEFDIPLDSGLAMHELSTANIHKVRYTLAADYAPGLEANKGLNFELDVFSGLLHGVCIVECEYDGKRDIVVPSWFGHEIIGKSAKILSNLNMAFNPASARIEHAILLPGEVITIGLPNGNQSSS